MQPHSLTIKVDPNTRQFFLVQLLAAKIEEHPRKLRELRRALLHDDLELALAASNDLKKHVEAIDDLLIRLDKLYTGGQP